MAILPLVLVPSPILRQKAEPVETITDDIKTLLDDMLETMYEAPGIGLAANQVDLPFQLFVINPTGAPDKKEERVLINPVVQLPKGNSEAEEGCLSIPGVYGKVVRPAEVHVMAYDLSGNKMDEVVSGTMARVIQHEYDHLQGVLFPDRMTDAARKAIEGELDAFTLEYEAMLKQDEGLLFTNVKKRLAELEAEYC